MDTSLPFTPTTSLVFLAWREARRRRGWGAPGRRRSKASASATAFADQINATAAAGSRLPAEIPRAVMNERREWGSRGSRKTPENSRATTTIKIGGVQSLRNRLLGAPRRRRSKHLRQTTRRGGERKDPFPIAIHVDVWTRGKS